VNTSLAPHNSVQAGTASVRSTMSPDIQPGGICSMTDRNSGGVQLPARMFNANIFPSQGAWKTGSSFQQRQRRPKIVRADHVVTSAACDGTRGRPAPIIESRVTRSAN
jgi:hypothetical protein